LILILVPIARMRNPGCEACFAGPLAHQAKAQCLL